MTTDPRCSEALQGRSHSYEKPPTPSSGLRLHLNENTGGCSPAVLEALRTLTCTDAAFYADSAPAAEACARHLGVEVTELILTNGLDEGILATSVASLRGGGTGAPYEAIVVTPAFDMYAATAAAAGGRVVEVRQSPDFAFPLDEVLASIGAETRLIFLTNPNNPTGLLIPKPSILAIADAAAHAIVFLDEAYADFSGTSLIQDADTRRRSNIVIGRTFAKAYGLAALRVGAVVGAPATLEPIRRVVPPYSINVAAAKALPAALADRAHVERYLHETAASKEMLYQALDRFGVGYWPSAANFVLARFGDRAKPITAALQSRGIYVRDRSGEDACRGCVRITTGLIEHTRQCIEALEEVLCAGA
jgi:histidinol-phosphate aminotransferase